MFKNYAGWWPLLLILAVSLFIFYPSLNYYFFQDDWFVLNWVLTQSPWSFLEFRTDIIYWRPLSMPIFFYLSNFIFDLNPFGYHLIVFIFFFALVLAVYKLFSLLLRDTNISLFLTFLYAVWPIHFMGLSWLSTTSYILGALFQVWSFIFFVYHQEKKRNNFFWVSFVLFNLALFSSELALVLPLIILAWAFFIKKRNLIIKLLPFFVVDLVYLIMRLIIYPIPAKGDYEIQINHLTIDNFLWYIAWAFNLPESFKELIDQSFPAKSIKILFQFWQISISVILLMFVFLIRLLSQLKYNYKAVLFGFIWIVLGLSPVIFLSRHSYNVYLIFTGLGLLFIFGTIFKKTKTIWLFGFSTLWLLSSIYNLQFTRSTHWVVNEQAISRAYSKLSKKLVENPQPYSMFLIWPPDRDFSQANKIVVYNETTIPLALSYGLALKVIYNNQSLETIFVKQLEPLRLPADIPVYTIKAETN